MSDFPVVSSGANVPLQVLSGHPDLMVVSFRFDEVGTCDALHNHPHIQSTYVESGRFRFTLGDEEREDGHGDSFVIPSNLTHGCVCLEPGQLVDCFMPRRNDFL